MFWSLVSISLSVSFPAVTALLSSGKVSVLIAATSTLATSTKGAGKVKRMPGSSVSE
ncbi:hypothetical protein D9M73_90230 [compost metagenome]